MDGDDTTPRARVVFIGPMGAGKTTIGKRVARLISAPFLDSDAEFVRRHGAIAAFFELHGEGAFRHHERAAVAEVMASDAVVALGGGAVLDLDTRADLARVPVVLLTTTPEAVADRIGNGKRPLVRGGVSDWTRIYESRRAVYESLADLSIDTSRRPISLIAAEIADWLRASDPSTTTPATGSHS
ncbi:shikimate kinase [Microbacteriaceae bacterium VKM Ac-2855]|nr:shikimate kinase [Microbacteriaceae bacterium VKM Ac-2855]